MLIKVSGQVIGKGKSKAGNEFIQLLTDSGRKDGSKNVVMAVSKNGALSKFQIGQNVEIVGSAFVRVLVVE